jgi:hypothetical protein
MDTENAHGLAKTLETWLYLTPMVITGCIYYNITLSTVQLKSEVTIPSSLDKNTREVGNDIHFVI